MKICYLGNYKNASGYSVASENAILALDSIGATVVPRHVNMTGFNRKVHPRILELEQNDLSNVDVVIQCNLPSMFAYKGGITNIGYYFYESNRLINLDWLNKLSLMDKILVGCNEQKEALANSVMSFLANRTYVIPCAINTEKFNISYPKNTLDLPKNATKFYTIAELGDRKNLQGLIAAYTAEFDASDNVGLIIKSGANKEQKNIIKQLVDNIRSSCGKFADKNRYPKIVVVSGQISEEDLNSIHSSCDIYVNTSHGESACLPGYDALGFGKRLIAPKCGAFLDYANYGFNITLVNGQWTNATGAAGSPIGLYTSNEDWFDINLNELRAVMRQEASISINKNKIQNDKVIENLSYEAVGKRILEIIDAK